ncbi:hypothetical protein [uncultured Endozoicomonas sp.]|nr:hypothetical protein [uncultured Endozoicomonas sp.]
MTGKGLQALHRKEVIHQDLRPANIIFMSLIRITSLNGIKPF